MNYKGYSCKLSGVYKIKNSQKLYSLEIYKNSKLIYKTDWIYDNQERAFKDAKEMIKKDRFDTEIIRENTNKENLNKDITYKYFKRKNFFHYALILFYIMLIISFIMSLFRLNNINTKDFDSFILINFIFGITLSTIYLYNGIFDKNIINLNNNTHHILGMINNIFNRKTYLPYFGKHLKKTKKFWSSAGTLILLSFEFVFSYGVKKLTEVNDAYLLLYYNLAIITLLLFIIYILAIFWEIYDSKSNGHGFPFVKILIPILFIIFLIICCYIELS